MEIQPTTTDAALLDAEVERAIQELTSSGSDPRALADAWFMKGRLAINLCRFDDSLDPLERALSFGRETTEPGLLLRHIILTLMSALDAGSVPASEAEKRCGVILPDLGLGLAADAMRDLARATFASMRGDGETARDLVRRAVSASEDGGLSAIILAWCLEVGGWVERRLNDTEAEESFWRRCYSILVDSGAVANASTVAGALGEALCRLGRIDEAAGFGRTASETTSADDLLSQLLAHRVSARLESERGDGDAAARAIEHAMAICSGMQSPEEVGLTHLCAAEILESFGRNHDAEVAATFARVQFETKSITPLIERTDVLIARLRRAP